MGTSPLLWGSCQVGCALRSFLVVVEFEELVVVVSPERRPRRAVRGLGAQRRGFAVFLLERFLFIFRERFFSPRANCYPQAHPQGFDACIMTYSGREEERAPSIYRSSCFARSAAMSRVRRSKGFSSRG
jgi:hypothetical protein